MNYEFNYNIYKTRVKMFEKIIIKRNLEKHNSTSLNFEKFQIYHLMCNASTHLVSLFKDYLLYDDSSEFLKSEYKFPTLIPNLKELINYYVSFCYLFPNYTAIPEGKFIYDNITSKQALIDCIEDQEIKINNKIDDIWISTSDIFDSKVYNNIITETGNNSKIKDLFSISPKKEENKKNESIKNLIEVIEGTEKFKQKKRLKNCLINKTFLNITKFNKARNYVMTSKINEKNSISNKKKNNNNNNNSTNYKSSSSNSNANKSISSSKKQTKLNLVNLVPKKIDKNKLCIDILNNKNLKFMNLNIRIHKKFPTNQNTSRAKSKSIINTDESQGCLKAASSNNKNIKDNYFFNKINKTNSFNFLLLKKIKTARNNQHSFAFHNQNNIPNAKYNYKFLFSTNNNNINKHSKINSIPLKEISNLINKFHSSKSKNKSCSKNKNLTQKIINKNNILKLLVNKNTQKNIINKSQHAKNAQSLNLSKIIFSLSRINRNNLTYRNNKKNKNNILDSISSRNNSKKKTLKLDSTLKKYSKDKLKSKI